MAFTLEELELLQSVSEAFKYVPIIYREVILTSNGNPSDHYVKHKIGQIDINGLFFFIPLTYDVNGSNNTQYIKLLQPGEGFTLESPNIKTYKVMFERTTSTGETVISEAKPYHLKPQRLYMMRLLNADELIIINYSYNDLLLATKLEADIAEFKQVPKVIIDDSEYSLVKSDDFTSLVERVDALERKILINTQAPEEALANEDDGTIYVKVEDYGSTEG